MRIVLLAALLAVTAACGSDSAADTAADKAADKEDAALAFSRCMREQGIDMPDPGSEGGGARIRIAGKAEDFDSGKLEKAHKACEKFMPEGGPRDLDPETEAEVQEAMLKFARCMREHGVDMPDPQPGGRGIVVKGSRTDPDFDSQKFRDAEKDCRKHTAAVDEKLGVTRSNG